MRSRPSLVEAVRRLIRRAARDLDELKMATADEKADLKPLKDELRAAAPNNSDSDDSPHEP